jgi:hypothetical protein
VRIKYASLRFSGLISQVNRQLNDKERVAAAVENDALVGVLNGMLATCT